MPKYGYLVVEGPHDVEFVYRLLSPFGLKRVRMEAHLDIAFAPLVPHTYPPDGDLQKRMTTPLFLQSATHAVAVHSAIGDTRLVETFEETATVINFRSLTGAGVLMDADSNVVPPDRYLAIRDLLRGKGFPFPNAEGEVGAPTPRLGAYVLPDNVAQGTLEHLLLDCANQVYPSLLATATTHVNAAIVDTNLNANDKADLLKPAGKNKAIVGSMASILRPGKAVQVSIQDNGWLRGSALTLPRIKAVQDFLATLFELR